METDYIQYWSDKFAIQGSVVTNEYGDAVEPEEMIRKLQTGSPSKSDKKMSERELEQNHAYYDSDRNVLRHRMDAEGFCIRNTDVCYDVIDAEFC